MRIAYQQVTDDFGQPAVLGGFRSRVLGVKAYGEFAQANRPAGWNTWLTFSISEEAPKAVTPTKHLVTK